MPELKGQISIGGTEQIDRATEKTREWGRAIESFFQRQTGAGRRAELAITGSIRELISGDIVGGLERLAGRMSTLGLGGGIAVGVIATAVTLAQKQLNAFNQELATTGRLLAKMPEAGAGLDVMKKHVTDLMAAIKPKETGRMGFGATLLSMLGDIGGGGATERRQAEGVAQHTEKVNQIVKSLTEQREKTLAVTDAQKQEVALAERVAAIHSAQKDLLAEIISKHLTAAETQKLIHQVNMTAIAEEKKARIEAYAPFYEKMYKDTGLKANELRKAGELAPAEGFTRKFRQTFPVALQGDAYLLGISDRMSAEAQRLRGLGFRREALTYETEAQRIRSGIGSLAEDEKMPAAAFLSAIQAADIFKTIATNTENTAQEVAKINFTNQ